ncbi:monooxygenase [uncultured Ferrimonas sp.]|uniref:monooxygenase n=1 Tax=uncultured Ferrimonas sp. TaxID=432640 RepID=UPI00262826AF|nr:monooxygenase [uncultured Ferrimonas sp.]
MNKLLQVDFEFNGPFGDEMAAALGDLAKSINQEPGLIWKIWTESAKNKLGGGIYLFEDEATAQAYLDMHSARLQQMGIDQVNGQIFDVNPVLSQINHGPIQSSN